MAQSTFYSVNYIGWPPVPIREFSNPDSAHWKEMASAAITRFDARAPEFLTKGEWEWLCNTVTACLGKSWTYKQLYEIWHAATAAMKNGVTVQAIAYAAGVLPEGLEAN